METKVKVLKSVNVGMGYYYLDHKDAKNSCQKYGFLYDIYVTPIEGPHKGNIFAKTINCPLEKDFEFITCLQPTWNTV